MYSKEEIKTLEIVQKTVKDHGVKILADCLNISPQTLYSDVDPNSVGRRTNKLGFLDWLVLQDKTKDLSSLDAVNRMFDSLRLPIPKPSAEMNDMSWMEYCATIAKESGEAVAELANAIMGDGFQEDEMERCEKETYEALLAFAGLYLAIKNSRSKKN